MAGQVTFMNAKVFAMMHILSDLSVIIRLHIKNPYSFSSVLQSGVVLG